MFNEKHVVVISGISGVLNLIACIATTVVWLYWTNTLSNCSHYECECILFGESRGTSFIGGRPIWCKLTSYSFGIMAIVSFGIAAYFFIKLRTTQPKTNFNRAAQTEDSISQHRYGGVCRNKTQFPVVFKLSVGFIALLMFIVAVSYSEGYSETCKEYRNLVVKHLTASGYLHDLVTDRLSCATVFDFLDYLHPDAVVRNPYLPQYYYQQRGTRINTGNLLLSSIIFSWINVILWCILTIFVGCCR